MNDIQKKKHYDATISHLIKDCGFEDTPYLHTTIKRFLSIHRDIPLQKLQGVLLGAAAISKINKQDKFETLKQCLQYAFQTNDRHILDELMNIFSHIKYSHKATNRQDSTTHSQNLTPEERIAQIRSGLTNIEDVMQGCLTIANCHLIGIAEEKYSTIFRVENNGKLIINDVEITNIKADNFIENLEGRVDLDYIVFPEFTNEKSNN